MERARSRLLNQGCTFPNLSTGTFRQRLRACDAEIRQAPATPQALLLVVWVRLAVKRFPQAAQ